jgi:hypothetical protein
MRLHPGRLDIVLPGSLQIGVAEQVRADADLLGRAVDELGHRAVPEQVGQPNVPAEGLFGAGFDLLSDRRAAHRAAAAIEPEVPPDTAHLGVSACN